MTAINKNVFVFLFFLIAIVKRDAFALSVRVIALYKTSVLLLFIINTAPEYGGREQSGLCRARVANTRLEVKRKVAYLAVMNTAPQGPYS